LISRSSALKSARTSVAWFTTGEHGIVEDTAPVLGHDDQMRVKRGNNVPATPVLIACRRRSTVSLGFVQVRYRYRLYPSPGQEQALARAFGCARVVFNDCLRLREARHAAGEKISDTEVQRRVITLGKITQERAWLGEVASVALVQACQDARRAYRNWFDSLAGKRKGRKAGRPRFRCKHGRQSIRLTRNGFALHGRRLYVAKVGDVDVEWSRDLPSVPSSVTVIREPDGRYYASFVVQREATPLAPCDQESGIDVGLASLAVTSEGKIIANPRFLRAAQRRLAAAQRALARKQKGSRNRDKARRRVAVLHRKVRDARLDHAHKAALALVRDSQTVYAEDITVAGLVRTRLAKSVHDAGWAQFLRLVEDKCAQYGREFRRIGRFEPTSQVCSACGVKDGRKPLHVREWTCGACGTVHDRDINAAKNILAAGRAERLNACGGQIRPAPSLAQAGETGTHRARREPRGRNPRHSRRGGRQSLRHLPLPAGRAGGPS
jgi:putative transposase